MAKKKQRKRQTKQETQFFESLPLTMAPPVTGDFAAPIRAGAAEAWQIGREAAAEAARWGRAASADLVTYGARLRRLLWNRRMRALYLAIGTVGAFSGVIVGTTMAAETVSHYASDISSPNALLSKKKVGTTILDRNGQVLYQTYGAQDNTILTVNQIPQSVKDATVAAEDPSFYTHPGFSWRSTIRAAWVDITHMGKYEGGSTLTQQLVKNALLTSNKSFERKYQELLLSTELEHRYSKDQILGMYLNEVYYGEGASGIEAASQTYFHKPAAQLDLSQSALLAGLPLGPSRFDPTLDLASATQRRDYVLDRMQQFGKITAVQAAAAKAEPIVAYQHQVTIKAPWFVFYVLDQLKTTYGDDAVEQGGITVHTTLDLSKQTQAEQIVSNQISKLGSHNVTNGALVSLDPKTGDILAMVGSANYDAPGWGAFNVVTQGQRQPGSSFKPFAYVTAFEKGWTGANTVVDAPVSFPLGGGQYYTPENYDLKFHGTVTLRHALDNSLNIPAIKVLQYAGVDDTITTADKLGANLDPSAADCGLSLVLGCAEVTPLDMATAYATFDNAGTKVMPQAITSVSDRYGKDITKKAADASSAVLDPRYAYMITNILSDNQAREPEFPFNSPLRLTTSSGSEIPAAAKTGTTNDFRDNWTVGYTPSVVTAVWVGNSDNSPMQNVDGITGAAPIWHDYMEFALTGTTPQAFPVPTGIVTATVCSQDGGLANPWDAGITEVFPIGEVPTKHCGTEAPAPSPSPSPSPDATPVDTPNPGKHHFPF